MEEVLDLVRWKIAPSRWYWDEARGVTVAVTEEASKIEFGRVAELCNSIHVRQTAVKDDFIVIGACLAEIERDKLYRSVSTDSSPKYQYREGFTDFYKFCEAVFGFKKRTAANLVAVYREFCDEGGILKLPYLNYSYSQLVEMSNMAKYRERIPIAATVRQIRKAKELYKDYTPPQGTTFQDDLAEYEKRRKEKQAEASEKKNALTFIPAKAEMPAVTEQVQTSAPDEYANGEEEQEVVTPETGTASAEYVLRGLMRQLELLAGSRGGERWQKFVEIVTDAVKSDNPDAVCSSSEREELEATVEELRKNPPKVDAPQKGGYIHRGKLNLKNRGARFEWLDKFAGVGKPWLELPELHLKLWRYDFDSGASLIRLVGATYWTAWTTMSVDEHTVEHYYVMDPDHPKFDIDARKSRNQVVDWLTENAKQI